MRHIEAKMAVHSPFSRRRPVTEASPHYTVWSCYGSCIGGPQSHVSSQHALDKSTSRRSQRRGWCTQKVTSALNCIPSSIVMKEAQDRCKYHSRVVEDVACHLCHGAAVTADGGKHIAQAVSGDLVLGPQVPSYMPDQGPREPQPPANTIHNG